MDKQTVINDLKNLGFELCGWVSLDSKNLEKLTTATSRYEEWLSQGWHGGLHYLERHAAIKSDPTQFFAKAQSILVVGLPYTQNAAHARMQNSGTKVHISSYVRSQDYHNTIYSKLDIFMKSHKLRGRAFVDAQPVFDRSWALLSGLGWIGRNSLLINQDLGSFFFIGGLVLDSPAPDSFDVPSLHDDRCGKCTRCITACPTDAIDYESRMVDSKKCIAFHTVENKNFVSIELATKFSGWLHGCDICQDVCPWNKKALRSSSERNHSTENLLFNKSLEVLTQTTHTSFNTDHKLFATLRVRYWGFMRNLAVAIFSHPELTNEKKSALLLQILTTTNAESEKAEPHIKKNLCDVITYIDLLLRYLESAN